jgi:hypothetical protein
MIGAEWLNGLHPDRMYNVVRHRATTRQVRLYMVACCRLKAGEFFDQRIPFALEAAERCADDRSAEAVANGIWNELVTSPRPQIPQTGPEGDLARAIAGAWQLLDEAWDDRTGGMRYHYPQHALAHAVYMSLRDKPREVFTGGSGNAAGYCARIIATIDLLRAGVEVVELGEIEDEIWKLNTETRIAAAHLLRDIFGNPFRPISFDPSWRTSTAVALAEGVYADRAFSRLPILADALEDAGCDAAELLAHLRGDSPHVRGCWALDLVLGKA